ncbi:MAG: hypothetical protein M3407_07825 [Acidobacteriota bacterium]|jgi:hypothetical protein|nr:hypothetical protein [Acidobacteriota bacterium]
MSTVEKNQQAHVAETAAVGRQRESTDSQADGNGLANPAMPADDSLSAEGGNIDKIRDILFGGQMRDYERRFFRIEERLLKESADLREDTRRRFEALETFIKNEMEALSDRLQAEQGARDLSVQGLTRELQAAGQNLEQKIAQLDEQTARKGRDLRQQILDQSKNLNDEIRRKYEELSAMLEREAAELRNDKTDRSALAALFTEVALRLNNEFKIPGDN